MRKLLAGLAIILCVAPAAAASRIKDITDVQGIRDNQLVGYGLVIGLASAWMLSTSLAPFVYGGSSPRDWLSFAAGPVFLLIAGILACAVPAKRVAQTDPMQVLRES